jgi:hypothetical protein
MMSGTSSILAARACRLTAQPGSVTIMAAIHSALLGLLLLSATAASVRELGSAAPIGSTALVLLRQRPTGLRWLDERWAAVTDPLSPDYRHFSSAAEIVRSVAPAPAERKVAERWVAEQGWIVSRRYGDALQVTRSAPSVQQRAAGAAVAPAVAPAVVVSVVLLGMHSRSWRWGEINLSTDNTHHRVARTAPPLPTPLLAMDAQCIRTLYDTPSGADATTASGVRVGTWQGGGCRVYPPDIARFCELSGLGSDCTASTNVSLSGGAVNATSACIEGDLDTEMMLVAAGSSAQSVVGVNNGSSFLQWSLDWFAEDGADGSPDIATVSWGGGEGKGPAPPDTSNQMRLNIEMQKLGVQGKAVFWAAGDAGTGGQVKDAPNATTFHCGYDESQDPEGAQKGFTVGFPATSPFVTACGGTELGPDAKPMALGTAAPICQALVSSNFSSGCGSGTRSSSLSRNHNMDEVANSVNVSGFTSGGGFSWWFARPGYQAHAVATYLNRTATTLPEQRLWNVVGRGIPDVASAAGNLGIVTNGTAWAGGGTSAVAPLWGGVWALATKLSRELTGKPLGPANPFLYHLAATNPSCFHDVTQGDNKCPFGALWQGNSCNCSSCQGFEAAPGWDPVTGLGTPNVSCILEAVRNLPPPRRCNRYGCS